MMNKDEFAYSKRKTVSNAKAFLLGKALSALATIVWLGLAVRLLGIQEYALYVAAIAALEMGIVISTVGMDWLVLRYLPVFFVKGAISELRHFVIKALLMRLAFALGLVAAFNAVMWFFASSVPKSWALVAVPLSMLLITESAMRLLRDNVLESLGAQRLTQLGVLLRTIVVAGLALLVNQVNGGLDASLLLKLELVASVVTLIYAAASLLIFFTRSLPSNTGQKSAAVAGDELPVFGASLRLGLHNYASTLISFSASTQAMTLAAASMSGAAAVATFGFICRLFDIARGYVPGLMLMSVLRPRFIGLYSMSRDFSRVAAEALLASRLSMLTVAPVAAAIALFGDVFIAAMSGGKFDNGGAMLACLVASLLLRVHRQISVVLANCVELSSMLVRISLLGLLGWPFAWVFFESGHLLLGAVALVFVDELIWVFGSSFLLSRRGFSWGAGVSLFLRSICCAAVCAGVVWLVVRFLGYGFAGLLGLVLGSIAIVVLFVPISFLFGLWSRQDLSGLALLVRKK